MVEGVKGAGEEGCDRGDEEGDADNPGRAPESGERAAHGFPSLEGECDGDDEPSESDVVEPVLEGTRCPDHGEDEAIANEEFADGPGDVASW